MAPQPEQQARGNIDVLLEAAGWHVYDAPAANIRAAIRERSHISHHGLTAFVVCS